MQMHRIPQPMPAVHHAHHAHHNAHHHKHRHHKHRHQLFHVKPLPGPVVAEMLEAPMASTTWMEARDQPIEGQRAVMHVIMNRVHARRRRWGYGIAGVVGRRKQFSCWNVARDGALEANRLAFFRMLDLPETNPEKRAWRQIQRLSVAVGTGRDPDNTNGATFYATVSITPYWRYDMTVVGQIGDHVFFRPQNAAEAKAAARDRAANARLARARRIARKANRRSRPTITHRLKA